MSSRRSRYEVLAKIASGGMATVYAGRVRGAVGFSRLVAIKRPHPFVNEDVDMKQQLEAEARVASMIHHPNVVSVLDVEEVDGELVLVMDYVEGCTLKTLADHAGAAESFERVAVRIILDVAAGLHAAHRLCDAKGALLGVVHRDVSPQNVLLGVDGSARLTDFGIAKIAASEADPTATDIMKGKIAYLAPEYVKGRRFDARSDLFALGVVAWETLARQRLFKGANTVETLTNILEGRIPPLSSVRPELQVLDEVIAKALARESSDRHESVQAFGSALEARARAEGGVATHAEVGALVEQVAGAAIAARRQVLEAGVVLSLDEVSGSHAPLTDRDHIQTSSLAASPPEAPTSLPETPSNLAATVTLRMGEGDDERGLGHRPRRSRASWVAIGVALLLASTTGMVLVNARRGSPGDEAGRASSAGPLASSANGVAPVAAGADSPSASSAALAADSADPASSSALTTAPATSTSSKRPRNGNARTVPRATTSSLIPAHAPPNPYPH